MCTIELFKNKFSHTIIDKAFRDFFITIWLSGSFTLFL